MKKIYNKAEQSEKNRKYYQSHRESIIKRIRANQIRDNYSLEKTPKQRRIRFIKRKTRKYFPLENKRCDFCFNAATEHHHNTDPIQFDKFNYVCHEHHVWLHKKEKENVA